MLNETQSDWANLLGIRRETYNMKEKGHLRFSDDEKKIIKMHLNKQGLKVTIDELFF